MKFTKQNLSSVFLTIATLLLMKACTLENHAKPDLTDIEQSQVLQSQIEEQWSTFIGHWENEEADSLAFMYAEEANNISPNGQIRSSREEIASFYNSLFSNNKSSEYKHSIETIDFDVNSAVELGNFQVNWKRNDDSTWTFQARSVTHWVVDEDGKWKIKLFFFNTIPD